MRTRRWLLPTLVALPLLTVAAIDVVRTATRSQLEDLSLLDDGSAVMFDATTVVADLRPGRHRSTDGAGVVPVKLGAGWGSITPQGRWTDGPSVELDIEAPVGGQTALFIEGRADRNHDHGTRLAVTLGGRDAGGVDLTRTMERQLLLVPAGIIRAGHNPMELRLVDPSTGNTDTGRTALIKRLAMAADDSGGFPASPPPRPVRLASGGRELIILVEGRIGLPFRVPVSGSELDFRYRFRDPVDAARCRVVVGRRYQDPERFDVMRQHALDAGDRAAGRIRLVLRDRGEPSVLFIHVNAAAARGGFVLKDPRIVVRPDRNHGRR